MVDLCTFNNIDRQHSNTARAAQSLVDNMPRESHMTNLGQVSKSTLSFPRRKKIALRQLYGDGGSSTRRYFDHSKFISQGLYKEVQLTSPDPHLEDEEFFHMPVLPVSCILEILNEPVRITHLEKNTSPPL